MVRILSLNVGRARQVEWKGGIVSTGIFKQPVGNRVRLRKVNLDGDEQADPSVHGGPEKAVYAYSSEHYEFWQPELERDLNWGMFGENFTLNGGSEADVRIGDRYRVGSAVLMVTQPRTPCFKLALKFGRDDIIQRFLTSLRCGFYLSVIEEGEVGRGDEFEFLSGEDGALTVAEINQLYTGKNNSMELLQRAASSRALPVDWRVHLARRFGK